MHVRVAGTLFKSVRSKASVKHIYSGAWSLPSSGQPCTLVGLVHSRSKGGTWSIFLSVVTKIVVYPTLSISLKIFRRLDLSILISTCCNTSIQLAPWARAGDGKFTLLGTLLQNRNLVFFHRYRAQLKSNSAFTVIRSRRMGLGRLSIICLCCDQSEFFLIGIRSGWDYRVSEEVNQ